MPTETHNGYIEDTRDPDNVSQNIYNENTIYHLESCRDGKAYLYSPYNLGNKYPYDYFAQGDYHQTSIDETNSGLTENPIMQPEIEMQPEIIKEDVVEDTPVMENKTMELEDILSGMSVEDETIA